MPDVYASIAEADEATLDVLARAMEVSAADPQHRAMVDAYLGDLDLPAGARVVEVGCGTGAISRALAAVAGEVIGTDPSPGLLTRAEALSAGIANLAFQEADGRVLPFADASFDAAVLHRVLSHVPGPEAVLAEVHRVLRPGGRVVAFDGDYATITLATGDPDPLQVCVQAFAPAYITDPWVARRIPSMLRATGFAVGTARSHGYVQLDDPDYMVSIADRGADALAASGRIGTPLADGLKAEARRRVGAGTFFGHVAYLSVCATRP
jgi:arsenite methyltransferase